jgi:signal transduction histidine kinase
MQSILTRLQNSFFPPLPALAFQTDTTNVLDCIQERVVTILLRLCVLFGFLSVSVGTVSLWLKGDWPGIIIGNISYVLIIFLAVNRKIHYRLRSAAFVTIAFTFLFLNLAQGLNEFSLVPLFAFVVMTTLLLGRRGGLFAFFVSIFTLLFINWRLSTGNLPYVYTISAFSDPFFTVLSLYTDWIFFVGIFFFTTWIYFDGFHAAWEREQRATHLLAEERDRLAVAFAREQQLLEELNQAHQREIELSRLKSQIISTVSHEFRTPLTVINNSVELLTRYGDNFTAKKREQIQQRIESSIYLLTELLQDASLVNIAYSQGFKANMGLLPFNGIGQRLKKELLSATHEPQNVVFQFDRQDVTAVCLDYDFLYRAVFSFLSNALKYSPPEETIRVTLEHQGNLRVSVSDQGMGIAPEDAPRIWEPFFRGRNVAEKQGLGLGLYLARRLVQAMEGTVTAVSPGLGQGTTFIIQIPSKPCMVVSQVEAGP